MASHIQLFWLTAEQDEWDGLWKRNCFKVWKQSDLAADDRVLTSWYVYTLKRDAISALGSNPYFKKKWAFASDFCPIHF